MSFAVSVVIPTYNYGRFIGEAVESVLAQTHRAAEIVVVDDGSTDETEDVLRPYGQAVRHVRQDRQGVCAARNRGVEESAGAFVAFLDADDRWHPQKVEKQLAKFAADTEVGLVHCGMREFDGDTGETLRMHMEGGEGWVADELLLWEKTIVNGPGGTTVVRREVFEEAGGFDPEMRVGEDWDFCYRVARKYKIGFVPEALVDYRSHASNAHRNVAEMERGMARFYEKAFATEDPHVLALRRRAYASFHRVLSGSYLNAGQYGPFLRHSVAALWNRPSNIAYFAKFPLRRLRNLSAR